MEAENGVVGWILGALESVGPRREIFTELVSTEDRIEINDLRNICFQILLLLFRSVGGKFIV